MWQERMPVSLDGPPLHGLRHAAFAPGSITGSCQATPSSSRMGGAPRVARARCDAFADARSGREPSPLASSGSNET